MEVMGCFGAVRCLVQTQKTFVCLTATNSFSCCLIHLIYLKHLIYQTTNGRDWWILLDSITDLWYSTAEFLFIVIFIIIILIWRESAIINEPQFTMVLSHFLFPDTGLDRVPTWGISVCGTILSSPANRQTNVVPSLVEVTLALSHQGPLLFLIFTS